MNVSKDAYNAAAEAAERALPVLAGKGYVEEVVRLLGKIRRYREFGK